MSTMVHPWKRSVKVRIACCRGTRSWKGGEHEHLHTITPVIMLWPTSQGSKSKLRSHLAAHTHSQCPLSSLIPPSIKIASLHRPTYPTYQLIPYPSPHSANPFHPSHQTIAPLPSFLPHLNPYPRALALDPETHLPRPIHKLHLSLDPFALLPLHSLFLDLCSPGLH